MPAKRGADAGQTATQEAGTRGPNKSTSGTGVLPFDSNGRFKVYEMISNSNTQIPPVDMDLPGLGAAGPIAGGVFMAGGVSFFFGFKRRLL